MSNLWVFGDSFSAEFSDKAEWSKKYIDWKKYTPKIYPQILSETLNNTLINNARGGLDNYSIFERIIDSSYDIEENDTIIIGWSTTTRFRLVNTKTQDWEIFYPNENNRVDKLRLCGIDENTCDEMLVNRTSMVYEVELSKFVKFVNFAFKTQKILHWRWDSFGRLKNYSRIKEETLNAVDDGHYSETGHKNISIDMLNLLNNENRINQMANFVNMEYKEIIKKFI